MDRLVRGWRFHHPDLDEDEGSTGLVLSAVGGAGMVEDEAAIRQALLLLLSTAPGERVMRPDYGCALNELVFSPNDETTAGIAMHHVRSAIERWEPRIELLSVDAGHEPGNPAPLLTIRLEYRVRSTHHIDHLGFDISLA